MNTMSQDDRGLYWLAIACFLSMAACIIIGTVLPLFPPSLAISMTVGAFLTGLAMVVYPIIANGSIVRVLGPLVVLVAGIVLMSRADGVHAWPSGYSLALFAVLCALSGAALVLSVLNLMRS